MTPAHRRHRRLAVVAQSRAAEAAAGTVAADEAWRPLPGYPWYEGTLAGKCRSVKGPEPFELVPRADGRYHVFDASGARRPLTPRAVRALVRLVFGVACALGLSGCTLEHVTAPGLSRWDFAPAPRPAPVHVHSARCRPAPVVSAPRAVVRSCGPEASEQTQAPPPGAILEVVPGPPPIETRPAPGGPLPEPTPAVPLDAPGAASEKPGTTSTARPPKLAPAPGSKPVRFAATSGRATP